MTIAQLARRWSVSRQGIRAMIDHGRIPGAFRVPSVGRYGASIRIPEDEIVELEKRWEIASCSEGRREKSQRKSVPTSLIHFPELFNSESECGAEYPAADQHSDGRNA